MPWCILLAATVTTIISLHKKTELHSPSPNFEQKLAHIILPTMAHMSHGQNLHVISLWSFDPSLQVEPRRLASRLRAAAAAAGWRPGATRPLGEPGRSCRGGYKSSRKGCTKAMSAESVGMYVGMYVCYVCMHVCGYVSMLISVTLSIGLFM